MAHSMIELHPAEFAELDRAWKKLTKTFLQRASTKDILAVLEAEAAVYRACNGRDDPELAALRDLNTPDKLIAATQWFQGRKSVYLTAMQNAQKASPLNKTDRQHQQELKIRISAVENAITILSVRK